MTDHRDDDLARRLAELHTPEHGPDFWSDLRSANSTHAASDADAYFVENEDPADSTRQPSDADGRFVENDHPVVLDDRRRRAPQIWLAAAAAVVLALVAVGLLLEQDSGEAELTTDPPPSTAQEADPDDGETAPTGPLQPEGEPIERGSGRVVAVDPAGEFLYVADDAPGGGFGCEGSPAQALFVEPIDGGERRPVLPPELNDATAGVDVRFGPEGEIAVHTYCEGFTTALVTGTLGDDGTVVDPTELTIPDLDLGRSVDWIVDLAFVSPGTLVVSTYTRAEGGEDHRHLYELPVDPSEVTDLGPTDVVHLDVTADGRLATATSDGTIRFDGEVLAEMSQTGRVTGLAVSPAGNSVFVARGDQGGLLAIDTAGDSRSGVTDVNALSIDAVGDDAAIVLAGTGPWGAFAWNLDGDGGVDLLVDDVAPTELAVTPDASRLFATRRTESGEPVVIEQDLTR